MDAPSGSLLRDEENRTTTMATVYWMGALIIFLFFAGVLVSDDRERQG
jgi:hypothetical protein